MQYTFNNYKTIKNICLYFSYYKLYLLLVLKYIDYYFNLIYEN